MKQNERKIDSDFSLIEVDPSQKKSFWPMMVVMLGFTFFSASMWAGGKLGVGLSALDFILAIMAGNLILGLYTGSLAFIAAKTGLSTHLLARYSFGEKGSFLPSFLLSITQVGWFGVGVVMFALPFQKVTGINIYLLIFISGTIMTFTAWFGIKALTILSFVAVPSITILGFTSVGLAVGEAGGIDAMLKTVPAQPMAFSVAVGICVASFISGGTLTPDFTRFSKTKTISVSTAVIAFFIGNSLMFLFGAVGAALFNESDISNVLLKQGMIIPAMIVLGLNIWTTNDNALYASGLGFSNITKLPKKYMVIINGIVGTSGAMYLYNNFIGFLSFLNTMLPSIGGILIADFFLVNRGEYPKISEIRFSKIRTTAVIAWLSGVLAAKFLPGIAPLNSVITAILVYGCSEMLKNKFLSKHEVVETLASPIQETE